MFFCRQDGSYHSTDFTVMFPLSYKRYETYLTTYSRFSSNPSLSFNKTFIFIFVPVVFSVHFSSCQIHNFWILNKIMKHFPNWCLYAIDTIRCQ
uniref:Uncharacterized protein n=1 Tax=Anguilla anguilla TaxID=7936 RepID=A0A0E9WFQ1_ANGAN